MSKLNTLEVKRELMEKRLKREEKLALVSGFVRMTFSLLRRSGRALELCLDCQNEHVRDYIGSLIMELFKVTAQVRAEERRTALVYADGARLLRALYIIGDSDFAVTEIDARFNKYASAYAKGVFLGVGGVSAPDADDVQNDRSGGYHIEFSMSGEALANAFISMLMPHNIYLHLTVRGDKYVLYVKHNEDVSDCLAFLGADKAVLKLNAAVAAYAVKGNVNRRLNFEMANMTRTVEAALGVAEAIERIEKTVGLSALDPRLREAAVARRIDPDAPINKLAAELGISKSGLKHRFDRITEFAAKL